MTLISTFSKWLSALSESTKSKYEYGCAMIFYSFPEVYKIQDAIDPVDIYEEEGDNTYGLEDEPHTTLLFGFHNTVDGEEVINLCKSVVSAHRKFDQVFLKLKNVSLFESEKYDVLKFDVVNPILHEINAILKQEYEDEYTTTFPNYHPHCTIGYIKKGKGQRYVDLFKDLEFVVLANSLVYSMPSGKRIISPI